MDWNRFAMEWAQSSLSACWLRSCFRRLEALLRVNGLQVFVDALPSLMPLTPFRDHLRVPAVLRPRGGGHGSPATLSVRMVARRVQLHSELPPTDVWTYEGHLPGPTIEVRRGQHVRVEWINALPVRRPYPVTAFTAEDPAADAAPDQIPQNLPGRGRGRVNEAVAALRPWTIVHLH